MTVIVSELQFFQVERELLRLYAVIFHQSLFSKRPESLETVDVYLTIDEFFPVIDSQMTESIWDETVITSEFIGLDKTSAFHFLDYYNEESFNGDILNNSTQNFSSSLQDTEQGIIPAAPHPLFPFRLPPKYNSSISISRDNLNEV